MKLEAGILHVAVILFRMRNRIFAIFATVDSANLRGKAEIFTVWKPPNFVHGSSRIDLTLDKKSTELFTGKVYFFKEDQTYRNFASGLSINLNKKWT